jgi:hypothetical protein
VAMFFLAVIHSGFRNERSQQVTGPRAVHAF